jgi:hypothetical protein
MSEWFMKHGGEGLSKARIWKDSTNYVFGQHPLPRWDGIKFWQYMDPNGNWAEAYTFDSLMQYLRKRGWL